MFILIAAVNEHGTIGLDGAMPWYNKEDFAHFKNTTMGHTVVMGRVTYQGIPKGLPGRHVLCVSRTESPSIDTISDFEAYLKLHAKSDEVIFIAGGASIYKQALPYASAIYLSLIHDNDVVGDTFFPSIDDTQFPIANVVPYQTFTLIERERFHGYHFDY